jgi:hypothetical protein
MFDVPLVALPVRLLFRLSCIMRIESLPDASISQLKLQKLEPTPQIN